MTIDETRLPADLLTRLRAEGASPALTTSERQEALAWLRRAMVDFDALDEHIRLLQSLYRAPFQYSRPRRDRWDSSGVLTAPDQSAFPHTDRLREDQVLAVLDQGPSALGNPDVLPPTELSKLLLNPYALYDLYDTIDDVQPDAWLDVMQEVGSELVRREQIAVPLPLSWPRRRAFRAAMPVLWTTVGLAAGLLLGLLLGRPAGQRDETLVARASAVVVEHLRGPAQDRKIKIGNDFDGFATVVVLIPGRRQIILPEIGGDPIRVGPGKEGTSRDLPENARNARLALAVVTETPAEDVVRQALEEKSFTPDQASELESYLQKYLREYNYHRLAFASIGIKPTSPAKP